MSALRERLADYLAVRRSLGYRLDGPAYVLKRFVDFAEREAASYITTALALRWVQQSPPVQPATRAARLGMVRRFAKWCSAMDNRTEVPPDGLLPHRYRRKRPYIYSDDEIARLFAAAQRLPSPRGLRAETWSTVFGLLAATGMRVSEVVDLEREDVDLEGGILTVRRAKFGKTRLIPVHPSTRDALAAYATLRDQLIPASFTQSFFVSERGIGVTRCGTRYVFAALSRQIGLRQPAGSSPHGHGPRHGRGPRVHDMRHRFAVKTLLTWYKAGLDIERELPRLSAYLGHVHVNDTYWYLEAVPELLALATQRLIDGGEEGGE